MNQTAAMREFEAYRKDDHEARSILDTAAAEGRATTPEEDERFDRLIASAEGHKKRADALVKMDQDAASVADQVRSITGETSEPGDEAVKGSRIADFLATEGARYNRALKDGNTIRNEAGVTAEYRAIADFSDATSLYVDDFATTVEVYRRTASPWIGLATVRTSTNGRPLVVPEISADPTGYTPGEGTAITESTPTFGTATVTLVSYKALAYVSAEADEDALYDVMPYISRTQGRSLGLQFGSAVTSTVVSGATNAGTATGLGGGSTATFFGLDDMITLFYSLAAPYRSSGSWILGNDGIQKARKFKDVYGQYLWSPSVAPGQPDSIYGRPVYEDPYANAVASASKSVLFGDVSALMVKQVPLRFAVSTDYRFNTDQIALKAVYRGAAALPDTAAIKYIVSANS